MTDHCVSGHRIGRQNFRRGALVAQIAVAVVLFITICVLPVHANCAQTSISVSDASQLDPKTSSIIDVRYTSDFKRGHIPGAVSLPLNKLESIDLSKDREIVVNCSGVGCDMSSGAAVKLREMGYTDVRVLAGGMAEWELKGLPVVHETKPVKPAGPGLLERPEVSAPVVKKLLGKLFILDTRPEPEFIAGHLPGAKNIPLEKLSDSLSLISGEVVVCDRLPSRWKRAVIELKEAGFDAHALSGGVGAWAGHKFALEVGPGLR